MCSCDTTLDFVVVPRKCWQHSTWKKMCAVFSSLSGTMGRLRGFGVSSRSIKSQRESPKTFAASPRSAAPKPALSPKTFVDPHAAETEDEKAERDAKAALIDKFEHLRSATYVLFGAHAKRGCVFDLWWSPAVKNGFLKFAKTHEFLWKSLLFDWRYSYTLTPRPNMRRPTEVRRLLLYLRSETVFCVLLDGDDNVTFLYVCDASIVALGTICPKNREFLLQSLHFHRRRSLSLTVRPKTRRPSEKRRPLSLFGFCRLLSRKTCLTMKCQKLIEKKVSICPCFCLPIRFDRLPWNSDVNFSLFVAYFLYENLHEVFFRLHSWSHPSMDILEDSDTVAPCIGKLTFGMFSVLRLFFVAKLREKPLCKNETSLQRSLVALEFCFSLRHSSLNLLESGIWYKNSTERVAFVRDGLLYITDETCMVLQLALAHPHNAEDMKKS